MVDPKKLLRKAKLEKSIRNHLNQKIQKEEELTELNRLIAQEGQEEEERQAAAAANRQNSEQPPQPPSALVAAAAAAEQQTQPRLVATTAAKRLHSVPNPQQAYENALRKSATREYGRQLRSLQNQKYYRKRKKEPYAELEEKRADFVENKDAFIEQKVTQIMSQYTPRAAATGATTSNTDPPAPIDTADRGTDTATLPRIMLTQEEQERGDRFAEGAAASARLDSQLAPAPSTDGSVSVNHRDTGQEKAGYQNKLPDTDARGLANPDGQAALKHDSLVAMQATIASTAHLLDASRKEFDARQRRLEEDLENVKKSGEAREAALKTELQEEKDARLKDAEEWKEKYDKERKESDTRQRRLEEDLENAKKFGEEKLQALQAREATLKEEKEARQRDAEEWKEKYHKERKKRKELEQQLQLQQQKRTGEMDLIPDFTSSASSGESLQQEVQLEPTNLKRESSGGKVKQESTQLMDANQSRGVQSGTKRCMEPGDSFCGQKGKKQKGMFEWDSSDDEV